MKTPTGLSQRAEEVIARCHTLAKFSEDVGSTRRTFLSPPMNDCHREVTRWLESVGSHVRVDAAGNLRGFYAGGNPEAPRLIVGSHLDTVPNAGAFDGILGVVLAAALLEELRGRRLPFGVEVVGFSEEEGVRFGTPFIGSRALVGRLDDELLNRKDADGISVREAIENFVNNPTPRGSLPGTLSDTHRSGEGQAPIMCWSAWHIYQSGHDKAWLARVYPGLSGYVNFWTKYHSSARGLVEFFNAGQIGDNDARFDRVYNRTTGNEHGNERVSGFESPDLNAFLVVEMRSLALMAAELGIHGEAIQWKDRADKLAQLIVDDCYFPDQAMFYDVVEGTHEIFSGVKDPNMFLPLWAGVPLPESEVHRIVEQHMLDPKEFFRELPFPSLSYDNPRYESGDYWRGKIWPHFVYWMAQALWRAGYHKEAELTADRLLSMLQIQPWLMENFNSDPEKIGKDGFASSQPEYNWTQAVTIELLLERYKESSEFDQVQSIK